jgi:hypothetical protein
MSLIFDQFPSRQKAEEFVNAVKACFDLDGQVFDDEGTAQEHDLFPFPLYPPIVHIDRAEAEEVSSRLTLESKVRGLVHAFGGDYAGT